MQPTNYNLKIGCNLERTSKLFDFGVHSFVLLQAKCSSDDKKFFFKICAQIKAGIPSKPTKCVFPKIQLIYLGRRLTRNGI